MKKYLKFIINILISFFIIISLNNGIVKASTDKNIIIKNFNNYKKLKNYDEVCKYLNLNDMKFISAYKIEDNNSIVGIINYCNEKEKTYYNLYTDTTPEIKFLSTQFVNKNNDKKFNLYTFNKLEFEKIFFLTVDKNGFEKIDKITKRSTAKELAFSWACLFSTKIACISASILGGAVVGGVTVGLGAPIAGGLAGAACSFVFGKFIETFGSKEYGCTLLKNGKLTWEYINNAI